jgi:hypothetical protein
MSNQMGALEPAEAGAPATPSKEAKEDLRHNKTVARRTLTRPRNPHAYPSEEANSERQRKAAPPQKPSQTLF